MPTHALLAVAALAGAASLSGRTQAGSRARMTAAQAAAHKARLVELLKKGRWQDALNLNEAKGKERLDLGGADLTGADLADAGLSGADLTGANLTNANLEYANLTDANLSGADLTGADLADAWLFGANLTGANLSRANLTNANLTNANPTEASLVDTDLEGAIIPDGFLAPNTRLDAVPWAGAPYGWRIIASPRGARFQPVTQA